MACSFAHYVGVGSQVISTKLLTDDNIVSKFGVKLKIMTRQKPEKVVKILVVGRYSRNSRISAKDALVMIVQTFFMQKIDTKNSINSIPVLQKLIDIIETYYRIDKKKYKPVHHIFFSLVK